MIGNVRLGPLSQQVQCGILILRGKLIWNEGKMLLMERERHDVTTP